MTDPIEEAATIRLAAMLVRACDDGIGHVVVPVHPETLREMALAAKSERDRLRAELAAVTAERDASMEHVLRAEAAEYRAESALARAMEAMPSEHEADCLRDCAEYMASRWTKTPPVPRSALAALDRLDAYRAEQTKGGSDA